MTLRELCRSHTTLCEDDIAELERVEGSLQLIADLALGDAFIDCLDKNGMAVVVAQAKPRTEQSRYERMVVGEYAKRENEPAVYLALEEGLTAHDLIALTQEMCDVSQDVAPIMSAHGATIGVLICERDVSREVRNERKLAALAAAMDNSTPPAQDANDARTGAVLAREAHHRIKNNLQMLASICNMRSRSAVHEETRMRLGESAGMLLSVAALHDILTAECLEGAHKPISLNTLLKRAIANVGKLAPEGISVEISGDEVMISQQRATTTALVVTELVTNAIEHAYPHGKGDILVSLQRGVRYCIVSVEDHGVGVDSGISGGKSMGLRLISMLVHDTLEGELSISSDECGTKAWFNFKP